MWPGDPGPGQSAGRGPDPRPAPRQCGTIGISAADRVGLGVAVAEDHEEVDEVGFLGASDRDCPPGRSRGHAGGPHGGRLGGGEAGDVLHVVEHFRRRPERRVAQRRAVAEVEGDLLAVAVHGDVPGVVEVHDLLETLEDTIMHVRFDERRVRPQVDIARRRGQEEAPELGDVARRIVEELGPVERSDGVAAEAIVDEIPPERVISVGLLMGSVSS